MKRLYILLLLLGYFPISASAQLTNMTPNVGNYLQQLQPTITGNGIFIQSSSPYGNLFLVQLRQGSDIIKLFDYTDFSTFFNISVIDANTITGSLLVPITAPTGVYDLEVTTGDIWDPFTNQQFYTLPAA